MRYLIGIDLGTTHCCVAYADLQAPHVPVQQFRIPQLVAENLVEAHSLLPSCCYLSVDGEFTSNALQLPWKNFSKTITGAFARKQGAKVPTRLVQSAKSWLCHTAANRKEKLLPVEASDSSQRMSPIEATALYLGHIRDAWNNSMAGGNPEWELEQQEVVITVPASFDEVARALTAEAAQQAGYRNLTFIEEPQAAFYAWIAQQKGQWQQTFSEGQTVLVCDIGGGTTDFSLIQVSNKAGEIGFQRMAVGNHLLLGGDNMDLALAHFLEEKLQSQGIQTLTTDQWLKLKEQSRLAKEALLSEQAPDSIRIVLQGTGSSVVKGSIATELSQAELKDVLLDGFFGRYSMQEALTIKRAVAIRTMGLPYEEEPSITKQLAAFLQKAQQLEGVDFLLFNGGVVKAPAFQAAIFDSLRSWFPQKQLQQLSSVSLDLAVARGAVYYAKVKKGMGIKITSGSPRAYYLQINTESLEAGPQALVLLPRGVEEGISYESSHTFSLLPNTPVAFQLLTSHVRLHDQQEEVVALNPDEMHPLPVIQTILHFGKKQAFDRSLERIPVALGIKLTELGTLELWLHSLKSDHRWTLEFQLRSSVSQSDSIRQMERKAEETFEAADLQAAQALLEACFASQGEIKPSKLVEQLEERVQLSRLHWPPSLLRALAATLLKLAPQRSLSLEYEARWWNLIGFLMRPGYGFPLDDFRMKELWKVILADQAAKKSPDVTIQKLICQRRVAGGFNKGQQLQLASDLLSDLLPKKGVAFAAIPKNERYLYQEKIRTLASFELLETAQKVRLGEALVHRFVQGEGGPAEAWALGRIGARKLVVGSVANVIPRDLCAIWIKKLLSCPVLNEHYGAFLIGQLARKSDFRETNLTQTVIDEILIAFQTRSEFERMQHLLNEETALTTEDEEQVFGEALPLGLLLTTGPRSL